MRVSPQFDPRIPPPTIYQPAQLYIKPPIYPNPQPHQSYLQSYQQPSPNYSISTYTIPTSIPLQHQMIPQSIPAPIIQTLSNPSLPNQG